MFTLTPAHELLLRGTQARPVGVYQLQLATALQLTRIHYRSGTLKTVKARLKQLVDNSYLTADTVPTRLLRSPYYYRLTEKGRKQLVVEESQWTLMAEAVARVMWPAVPATGEES